MSTNLADPPTATFDAEAFGVGYLECAAWLLHVLGPDDDNDAEADWIDFVDASGVEWRDGEATARFTLRLAGHDIAAGLLPDAVTFARDNATDLLAAVDAGRDAAALGTDFYLSRNGHGTGYWDRGLGEVGDRLHTAAKVYGDVSICAWPDDASPCGWSFEVGS